MTRGFLSAADVGVNVGSMPRGPKNALTDVEGVAVGHKTVGGGEGPVQTGVTVILPHQGNVFREKVIAASHVINGFCKTTGLLQVEELGQLESPIALTNTLSVPAVTEGLLDHLLGEDPEIGLTMAVNTVVAECNDAFLNDLRGRHVRREHVAHAIADATIGRFEQGAVGAGRGMSSFGLKGGIGTSSRRATSPTGEAVVGILVLSNFCRLDELAVAGRPVGRWLVEEGWPHGPGADAGSVIIVLATDAPVSSRQLHRLLRRVQNGLARTGSPTAHFSGEVAIGFSTATRIPHHSDSHTREARVLREESDVLDPLFQAVTEATEEAVLNSIFNAETVVGHRDMCYRAFPIERLPEFMASAPAEYLTMTST